MLLARLVVGAAALFSTGARGDCVAESEASRGSLTVRTITGRFTGMRSPGHPDVREFRNIPFAEPPIGRRRWLPPVALGASSRHRHSTRFPPSCPQYMPSTPSLWNSNITRFMVELQDQSYLSGLMAQTTSEDCLSLAIWTPLNVGPDDRLPVAFFMTGGSFQSGGIDVPYQQPARWVERTQKHIVVTINYRVNIVGFPNAAGLEDQNLGILDQRMALEWVYANIKSFGGDPDRITLWGQSAGGVSADVHSYAWHDNPLFTGLFMQSGSAMRKGFWRRDPGYTNFTFVARNLGCDFKDDPDAEIDCMRQVPISLIVNFMGQYQDNRTAPGILFRPTPDEKIIFANVTQRAAEGKVAKVPALISNTANEQSSLHAYPIKDLMAGPNKTAVDEANVDGFVCVTANTTNNRGMNRLVTYRYQYAGNFSNITPLWWMGAYHSSDVPLVFGTFNPDGQATEFETQVSEVMQDYLLDFITDPADGLRRKGWLPFDGPVMNGGVVMRFAAGASVARNVSSFKVDDSCWGKAVYNSAPVGDDD